MAVTAVFLTNTATGAECECYEDQPPVYWNEDPTIGLLGTIHAEVKEDDISIDAGDCVIENTLQDGPPALFYKQEFSDIENGLIIGKIRFHPKHGEPVWLTMTEVSEKARDICFINS